MMVRGWHELGQGWNKMRWDNRKEEKNWNSISRGPSGCAQPPPSNRSTAVREINVTRRRRLELLSRGGGGERRKRFKDKARVENVSRRDRNNCGVVNPAPRESVCVWYGRGWKEKVSSPADTTLKLSNMEFEWLKWAHKASMLAWICSLKLMSFRVSILRSCGKSRARTIFFVWALSTTRPKNRIEGKPVRRCGGKNEWSSVFIFHPHREKHEEENS